MISESPQACSVVVWSLALLSGEGEVMYPGNAEHGVVEARAFRQQSRRIFHVFIRAKTCSTRARTYLWDLLWSSFRSGSSV